MSKFEADRIFRNPDERLFAFDPSLNTLEKSGEIELHMEYSPAEPQPARPPRLTFQDLNILLAIP